MFWKTDIPQNSSSEPFLQSVLKSQMSAGGRHSPESHVNSPSEQEDTMTNNTAKKNIQNILKSFITR